MFKKLAKTIFGDPVKKEIAELAATVEIINGLEAKFEALSDDALRAKTDEFRGRLAQGETLDDLLPEAFAAVREASKRTIGLRHFDIQIVGSIALHQGKIIEMLTGEGKTLVCTMPIYLNALTGRGVHLVTVNDFLARVGARLMAPIYNMLGMSVGVLQMASRTENGRKAFLVDLEKESSQEDQHQLALVNRKGAYAADITYGTNNEFGFDYLRDNLKMTLEERVQRGHHYAVIDEVDNILIDEARTPLIISGPSQQGTEYYAEVAAVVRQLNPEDYEINERNRAVSLTEIGEAHVEELLNMSLGDPERPEDITPEQARMLGFLEQALKAQFLYHRNKEYLVQGGQVIIVDDFTGRLMPGRRWSEGLHQAVEAKEGVKIEPENVTYATITLQNYFRMYEKLSGMTGTAVTESEEFHKIYNIDVLPLPSNLEYEVGKPESTLEVLEAKDANQYKYTFYAVKEDPDHKPVFYKRQDFPDVVYRTAEAKHRAMIREALAYHVMGRPLLVGTTSVEHSELISRLFKADTIRKLAQVMLIRKAWQVENNVPMIDRVVEELVPLNTPLVDLQTGVLRQFARRFNLSMNPEDDENVDTLIQLLDLRPGDRERLIEALRGGIPHQVLNARKHDQEGLIIARAGAFGAVTIATNMAGRGVDIKLGGEIPENVHADVVRILRKAGHKNAFEMTHEEMRSHLAAIPAEEYGIYAESAEFFLSTMEGDERVREVGGLHVVGSERHEARRIDNQLRGRAARQGDPGSSRFYLSLEDDLMRIFGGQQAEALFARFNIDEDIPIEARVIGRLVEQSQERVEGSNFDIRKHLLEYDDVLNAQRVRIYDQREQVFKKEDLTEDVQAMLRTEMERRVPEAMKDEEGPWRLLSFLNQIQPTMAYEDTFYPDYSTRLLLDRVKKTLNHENKTPQALKANLLQIAAETLEAGNEHFIRTMEKLVADNEMRIETQRAERQEGVDAFFDTLEDRENLHLAANNDLLNELQELSRTPLHLSNKQFSTLKENDDTIRDEIRAQIDQYLTTIALRRLIGAVARRLDEPINLQPQDVAELSYNEAVDLVLNTAEQQLEERGQHLLGENGAISRELELLINKMGDEIFTDQGIIQLLSAMRTGSRMMFDDRTHRRKQVAYSRMHYDFLTARLLEGRDLQQLTEGILEHLHNAILAQRKIWGKIDWKQFVQAQATIDQFDPKRKERLIKELGQDWFNAHREKLAEEFDEEETRQIEGFLSQYLLNEIYRHLLLRVISDEWVEYLTKMDALRVSVGMESYAQRDPLVTYKNKASELYRELLSDIRMGVISRMFTVRPRREAAATVERSPRAQAAPAVVVDNTPKAQQPNQKSGKRKRHKR
ncbi:MAG: hypothetical protein JW750_04510 [Anaerolineaceae bacterium]|nr:hypothetical protein [Anaerolineaceae bacterium]